MIKTYLLAFGLVVQLLMGWSSQDPQQVEDKQVAFRSSPVKGKSFVVAKKIAANDVDYTKKITDLGITLHPGSEYASDSKSSPLTVNKCASLVYKTLQVLPKETVSKLKNLTLYFNSTGRRGLGGGSTIILRCENVTDAELVSVLVHEIGHIQDTGVLTSNFWAGESEFRDGKNPIYNDDLSLNFYRLSFKDDKSLRQDASDLDFVSGYAKSDPFEDFAETYNFYRLHGNNFRKLAGNNEILMKKYEFMRKSVFNGVEFDLIDEVNSGSLTERSYDSTILAFKLNNFLAI